MSQIRRRQFLFSATVLSTVPLLGVRAQQPRVYRVGIVMQGGTYVAAAKGLRDGLKEQGLEEGKQVIFHLRDAKSDLKSVEVAAKVLEQEKVDVIYSIGSSVTVRVKRATNSVPIVFYAGTDPVTTGLVASFGKPGGRLTGIYSRYNDLVAKRFQLLKELVPKMRRVATFYDPGNQLAVQSMTETREVAHRLKIDLVERQVSSVEDLRTGLRALRPREVDAFFQVTDGFIISQADVIVDFARERKLPCIFSAREIVAKGALAGYGVSYHSVGRLAAKHVQRILTGGNPGDMPVEQIDNFHFVINLKTAKAIGLSIPDSILARADEVIR